MALLERCSESALGMFLERCSLSNQLLGILANDGPYYNSCFLKSKTNFLPSEHKSDSENLAVLEVNSWL